jgi:cell division initiation protein
MTPNEILNKQFARGMNGYKSDEVNLFMNEVAGYVKTLLKERQELLEKMEVLAEKVEEYRTDEDSLRAALIGAQKLGDSVVREAKVKAQAILDEANRQADDIVGEAKRSIELENYTLERKKQEAAKFKTQLLAIYKQHIDIINSLPFDEDKLPPLTPRPASAPAPTETQAVDALVIDFGGTEELAGGNIRADYPESSGEGEEEFPKRKSRYGSLRFFGEGQEPKRSE